MSFPFDQPDETEIATLTTEQELRQKLVRSLRYSRERRLQASVTPPPPRSTVFVPRLALRKRPNEPLK
jgi:hypothetical protein